MNKYNVKISRNYFYEEIVEAENEEEAEQIVNDKVDMFMIYGTELYDDYNGSIELLEENVEVEDE